MQPTADCEHNGGNMVYESYIKRLFDILLSLIGIAVLAVPMLIVACIVWAEHAGSVFFRQKRLKKGKHTFTMLKFRTMVADAPDIPTHLLSSPEQYTTRTGRALRRMSLDELPQLFNILQGSMSFVGPRPAHWQEWELIEARDRYGANDVKPGLTGWAQINGRKALDIPTKAKFDGEYVEALHSGRGFLMDCRCIIGTVIPVLSDW